MALQHLGSERNNLHEAALAQLAGHRPEHARADRLALVVDQHRGVAIEADVAAVLAALLLAHPHDHRLHHLALLDVAFRRRLLDVGCDDGAEIGVAPGRSPDRVDHRDLARAGVVGDVEDGSHLDHGSLLSLVSPYARARSTTRTRAHRLRLLSGRASAITTVSPILAS